MAKIEHHTYQGSHDVVWTEEDLDRKAILPGGVKANADAFGSEGFVTLDLTSFNQGDTSITLANNAPEAIPADSFLRVSDGQHLVLAERVSEDDSSITVEPAAFGTSSQTTAAYTGGDNTRVYVPDGMLIGRTNSEATSDPPTGFGPVSSELSVAGVDTTNNTFTVAGNVTEYAVRYGVIEVTGSTGNDGVYNVVGASYDSTADETTIEVAENVGDTTADGTVNLVTDDQVYLTVFERIDVRDTSVLDVLRHGSHVYENLLPNWDQWTEAEKAAVRYWYEAVPTA